MSINLLFQVQQLFRGPTYIYDLPPNKTNTAPLSLGSMTNLESSDDGQAKIFRFGGETCM